MLMQQDRSLSLTSGWGFRKGMIRTGFAHRADLVIDRNQQ